VCCFADSPGIEATAATVFWDPASCRQVLHATALPVQSSWRSNAFRLAEIPCHAALLLTPDGTQHLLLRDGVRSLQLAIAGASILRPVHLLVEALPPRDDGHRQRALLACLEDLHRHGRLRARHFVPDPRRRRLRLVLQALDGWLAGASYREIATALLGAARIAADWSDPRRHLLDHVRRAVGRGRTLMRGGYQQFLV
jgi:hypothetical protein